MGGDHLMLSAAKHLVCRANRVARPEMLRGAQHDMKKTRSPVMLSAAKHLRCPAASRTRTADASLRSA